MLQECSSTNQTVLNETIIWPTTKCNTDALSQPRCLDEDLKALNRSCGIFGWLPAPNCHSIQKNVSLCPSDLHYSSTYNVCYVFTQAHMFPPVCPYPETLPFYDYTEIKAESMNEPIWMPVRRNISNRFGDFEWTEISERYGTELRVDYNYKAPLTGKNCIIYHNISYIEAVNCNRLYPAACVYTPLQYREDNYCQQQFPNSRCMPTSFHLTGQCFCTLQNSTTRANFCENLAEFKNPYQNMFPMNQTCWFGLEKSFDTYIWSNSGEEVEYTFWSDSVNIENQYGALKDWSGWTLEKDDTLSCAICLQNIQTTKSKLTLTYDNGASALILKITNPSNLKKLSSSGTLANCFTDTDLSYFKTTINKSFEQIASETETLYYYNTSSHLPGFYWCEAFQYPNMDLLKSNTVFVHDRNLYGNEYVMILSISYSKNENPTLKLVDKLVTSGISYVYNGKMIKNVRQMKILNIDEGNYVLQSLLHLTTNSNTGYDLESEYEILKNITNTAADELSNVVSVDSFLSSHYCYKTESIVNNVTVTWNTTPKGYIAYSDEICILDDGTRASRKCNGDFINGVKWSDFNGICTDTITRSQITDDLMDLLSNNHTSEAIISNLTELSEQYEYFQPFDIYIISNLMKTVYSDGVNLTNVAIIVDNVMKSNRSILRESQTALNATNNMLYYLDKIAINSNLLDEYDQVEICQTNTVVLLANLLINNVNGIAIYSSNSTLVSSEILYTNSSIEDHLEEENFMAAVIIPNGLLQQILVSSIAKPKLIITVFLEDTLFNEDAETNVTDVSKIFGVLLPEFSEEFSEPISVIFKQDNDIDDIDRHCAFWQFSSIAIDDQRTTSWSIESNATVLENQTGFVVCEFWHITHFAMLVLDDPNYLGSNFDFTLLDIINNINSALSMFGLAGILITSILFKNWRRNTGNQILINFVFAICSLIVVIYISNEIKLSDSNYLLCVFIGALLHYSVISQFGWMLVIAVLQFKRFVQVFGGPPRRVLVKACIVGWVIPLIPVICLLCFSPSSYIDNNYGLCYPSGLGMYLAVLMPIGIILGINIVIYIVIISDVFYKRTESSQCLNSELILQWRLVVLLFFMLGITWSFALLSYVYKNIFFIYIFCFTASLQGFVLFLFFIVFNKCTRMLYIKLFKKCFLRY